MWTADLWFWKWPISRLCHCWIFSFQIFHMFWFAVCSIKFILSIPVADKIPINFPQSCLKLPQKEVEDIFVWPAIVSKCLLKLKNAFLTLNDIFKPILDAPTFRMSLLSLSNHSFIVCADGYKICIWSCKDERRCLC